MHENLARTYEFEAYMFPEIWKELDKKKEEEIRERPHREREQQRIIQEKTRLEQERIRLEQERIKREQEEKRIAEERKKALQEEIKRREKETAQEKERRRNASERIRSLSINDDLSLFQQCIDDGAKPNIQLNKAIWLGRVELCRLLISECIKQHVPLNDSSEGGCTSLGSCTPLYEAIKNTLISSHSKVEICALLIAGYAKQNLRLDQEKRLASFGGKWGLETVRDPNQIIYAAINQSDIVITKMVIDGYLASNSPVNALEEEKHSPRYRTTLSYVVSAYYSGEQSKSNRVKICELLIDAYQASGLSIDEVTKIKAVSIKKGYTDYGGTILHHTAQDQTIEFCDLLIRKGANISARDNLGNTPLHLAARGGEVQTCELLAQNGADISARNHNRETPLDLMRLTNDGERNKRLTTTLSQQKPSERNDAIPSGSASPIKSSTLVDNSKKR